MSYCLLRQDCYPGVWMARASEDVDFAMLLNGSFIKEMDEPVNIILGSDSKEPSDLLEFPYFIVSDRMRNALTDFGVDNIQYFQTLLTVEEGGPTFDEYFLANVIGMVKCLDEAHSKFKKKSKGKKGIPRNFHIDENLTQGLCLFRIAESRRLIAISDDLRAYLEKTELQGIYYQNPEDYTGDPASSFWE